MLHIISKNGWIGALRGILTRTDEAEFKFYLEAENDLGETALLIAAKYGHVAVMTYLLENGAQPDHESLSGMTPLHSAAQHGHIAIMELLLEAGASQNSRNSLGYTPLSYAIENHHIAAIELLLKRGAEVDHNYAVEQMYAVDIIDSHKIGYGEMLMYGGSVALTKLGVLLLGLGVDTTTGLEMVELGYGEAALYGIAILATVGRMLFMLGLGALTNNLMGVRKNKSVKKNRMLTELLRPFDVKARPIESWRTPLSHAAALGDETAVRLLLKYNARPKDKDKDGETPLSRAEKNDRKEVIRILRGSMNGE